MELLRYFLLALLIDFAVALAIGKVMKWAAGDSYPIDEPMQYDASGPNPHWHE